MTANDNGFLMDISNGDFMDNGRIIWLMMVRNRVNTMDVSPKNGFLMDIRWLMG
jgi:hypothetical protein